MEQYKAFSQERCDIANNQMYICQLKSLVPHRILSKYMLQLPKEVSPYYIWNELKKKKLIQQRTYFILKISVNFKKKSF